MFGPVIVTASRVEQSSKYGCASEISDLPPFPSGTVSPSVAAPLTVRPTVPVLPETRLIAPGDDGPNVVPKKLSLIANCLA